MDLYGLGQSISIRGSADSATANANATNKEFNRTVASERDEIKSAASEQLADYEALSSGKVGVQSARLGSLGVSTISNIQKANKVATAGVISNPVPLRVGMGSFGDAATTLERTGGAARGSVGGAAASTTSSVAQDASIAGEAAEDLGTVGKIAGKLAIGVGGRTAITGLGLGTELYKGINRYESGGKFFGTNTGQQVGMGLSDVGGALQLAGLGMAAFGPVGWAAAGITELAGTALSIGGAIAETVGDSEDQDVQKDKADTDASSQLRGTVASENITTAASRGN
tara:strand:+ start:133 stop:987 length:855 start_codon:yes stop_codon:yes gene_type:complete